MEQLLQYTFWTQKTTDFQKSKSISLELGRAKNKHKEKRQRILGQAPATQEGSLEGGKFSAHSETFSLLGTGVLGTEGSPTVGTQKTKQREFITEIFKEKHFPAKKRFTLPTTRGALVLRFTLWGSDSRERSNVGCHENTLRELEHSWGNPGKSLGLSERQEIVGTGTL